MVGTLPFRMRDLEHVGHDRSITGQEFLLLRSKAASCDSDLP